MAISQSSVLTGTAMRSMLDVERRRSMGEVIQLDRVTNQEIISILQAAAPKRLQLFEICWQLVGSRLRRGHEYSIETVHRTYFRMREQITPERMQAIPGVN